MDIKIVGSTNGIKTKEAALKFGRAAGRVCYSAKSFEQLTKEEDKTQLTQRLLKSGHHSVFDHVMISFELTELPKIGAMLLNNEKVYTTSEKSARYTQMELTGRQKELYDKWMGIFQKKITEKYSDILDETRIKKLAQENARYLTSVFTPTQMIHTLSFKQLNYVLHYFEEFIGEASNSKFNERVKEFMADFIQHPVNQKLYVDELRSLNERHLSLFARRKDFKEQFGETYSINYKMSFACLAQAHRHRTLNYKMQPIEDDHVPDFFTPPIIKDDLDLAAAWVEDSHAVQGDYPQGMLIEVHESGTYTDFISKMNERLCGHAQLEIMLNTKATLDKYIAYASSREVYEILKKHSEGPRCTFNKCRGACEFGKDALERLI